MSVCRVFANFMTRVNAIAVIFSSQLCAVYMFEAELEALSENPLSSIFLLTIVTTLVVRKLYQLHLSVNKPKAD